MIKEVRRINFTGKNLNDVFLLPCVRSITKAFGKPYLLFDSKMMNGFCNAAPPGSELIEYDNGKWEVDLTAVNL